MTYEIRVARLQARPAAVVRDHVAGENISEFLGSAFGDVMSALAHQGIDPAGPPFARYIPTDDGGFEIDAGFPTQRSASSEGRVEADGLPGGLVAFTVHKGAYDKLADAYKATEDWLTDNGYVAAGPPWETYLDEPDVPEPRTEIFYPCESVRH